MRQAKTTAVAALCVLFSGCAVAQASNLASSPTSAMTPNAVSSAPAASPTSAPIPMPATVPASTPTPTQKQSATPATTASTSWNFADMTAPIPLVSKRYRLPSSYTPPATVGSYGLTLDANAAVEELMSTAHTDGVKVEVRSGYRDYMAQKSTYDNALRTYSSPAEAMRYNAPPGTSEHQTGLAVDMWDGVNRGTAFRGTATDKWIARNAYKFGFIIRYPKGKEAITGYTDEPWHLRYVGVTVAAEFGPNNTLTLEEYLGLA